MAHRIKVIKNFISKEDISKCIDILSKNDLIPFKDNPLAKVVPSNDELNIILKKYSDLANDAHQQEYGFVKPLYTVECFLTKWVEGTFANLHTDSHIGYEHIQFSTVIYLNDNFEGGEISFPNQDFIYKPSAGDVVIFPGGGTEHSHEVYKVLSGERYTIAMWHTDKENKKDKILYS